MSMLSLENYVVEPRGDGSVRYAIVCDGGRTKQDMKDECDINRIMARFQKTGAVSHVKEYGGQYGFAPAVTFHESVEIVRKAQEMFDDLPSKLRKKFDNDPEKFLAFVQDEKNADEMLELGLRERPRKSEIEALGDRLETAIASGPVGPEGTGPT